MNWHELAIIVFSRKWPSQITMQQNHIFEIVQIDGRGCVAIRGVPAIGVNESYFERMNDHGVHKDFVKSMFQYLLDQYNDRFQGVFLALHDRHFNDIIGYQDISYEYRRFPFLDKIEEVGKEIHKAVLFPHIDGVEIYDLLKRHLSDECVHNFSVDAFYRDICNFLTPRKSVLATELRLKVLTPLVALDLLTQAELEDDQSKLLKKEIKDILNDRSYDENYKALCELTFDIEDLEMKKKYDFDNFSNLIKNIKGAANPSIDHDIFKHFAKTIEDKITKMEKHEGK